MPSIFAGDVIGGMEALDGANYTFSSCRWRCRTCEAVRSERVSVIRKERRAGLTVCLVCRHRERAGIVLADDPAPYHPPRKPKRLIGRSLAAPSKPNLNAQRPVAAGAVFGRMELLESLPMMGAVGQWKCRTCGKRERAKASQIKARVATEHSGEGCKRCAKPHGGSNRPCVPVVIGERFGQMKVIESADRVSVKCLFQCVVCDTTRIIVTSSLNGRIAKGSTGCVTCDRKRRAEETKLRRAEVAQKENADFRSLAKKFRLHNSGMQCEHPKTLICTDPNNVKIWRCLLCHEVGGPEPWTAPQYFLADLFPGKQDVYRSEDDPGFENLIRATEDFLSLT